jgi:trimeric autotransporter adhesin
VKNKNSVWLISSAFLMASCGAADGPSLLTSANPANQSNSPTKTLPDLQFVDLNGVMYIADSNNNIIRKVATDGTITTIAGTPASAGSTGDGGLATAAKLNDPTDVVVDLAGANLYVADFGNDAIRKIDLTTGIITTVAGTIGSSGSTGDGGAAISAKLNSPLAVALDSLGNLYISDQGNCAIRKVDAVTQNISTVAGVIGSCGTSGDGVPATSARLAMNVDMAVDPAGNIYVGDYTNDAIRKVSVSTGIITTIAGTLGSSGTSPDGTVATSALLTAPAVGSVDSDGNVYFVEACQMLRKLDVSTGKLVTLAGTSGSQGSSGDGGPATAALLSCPSFTAIDTTGNLYVADTGNGTIRMINSNGIINRIAGTVGSFSFSGDNGPATSAALNEPFDLTF